MPNRHGGNAENFSGDYIAALFIAYFIASAPSASSSM
jgi:hypothetical protein